MTQTVTRWQYSEPLDPADPVRQITRAFRAGYLARADLAALEQGWLIRHDSRRMSFEDGQLIASYEAVKVDA